MLRACIRARAALAALKQAAGQLPDAAILINTLPMLEAQASSEIENIVTTADALFRNAHSETAADPATREALRYRAALLEGFRTLEQRPITTRTAEAICTRIKNVEMQVRKVPGTKLINSASGEVIYTPPEGEGLLRGLLSDWESFQHEAVELDPLVRMAMAHYQFEAIHPFTDGNGRTGRILNSLMLVEQGLLSTPILYLSRHIIRNKADYYRHLLHVTRDDAWEPWLLFMLAAVERTSIWTLEKIQAIQKLQSSTASTIRDRAPKLYSPELMTVIFSQPYCRIANLTRTGALGRQAAARHLHRLVEIGVLTEIKAGREKLFLHRALLSLLTE